MRRVGLAFALLLIVVPAAVAQVHFQGAVLPPHTRTVRPSNLYLSVDGTLFVGKVHWTTWGGRIARGYGRAEFHGCTPDCASAPSHHARALVRLSNIHRCKGKRWYSKVTVITRRASGRFRVYRTAPTNWAPC